MAAQSAETTTYLQTVLRQELGNRTNITPVLEWSEGHQNVFERALRLFSRNIQQFNRTPITGIPDDFTNVRKLKEDYGIIFLPTLDTLQTNLAFSQRFEETAHWINYLMIEGEKPKDSRGRNWLAFHTGLNPVENPKHMISLIIGGISHFYEEFLVAHEYTNHQLRGSIECALIETASQNTDGLLWHHFSDPALLNWVKGWSGFSEAFLEKHFAPS